MSNPIIRVDKKFNHLLKGLKQNNGLTKVESTRMMANLFQQGEFKIQKINPPKRGKKNNRVKLIIEL